MNIPHLTNSENTNGTKYMNRKMKKTLLIALSFMVVSFALGQQFEMDSLVADQVIHFRKQIPEEVFQSDSLMAVLLPSLEKATTHENDRSRLHAYHLLTEIASRTDDPTTRRKALEVVLRSSYDMKYYVKEYCSHVYSIFEKEDFSKKFINELKSLIHDDQHVNYSHLLLAGLLDLREEQAYIQANFVDAGKSFEEFGLSYFSSIEFAARKALGRMGDQEQVQFVLDTIQKEKPHDIAVHRLQDVAYLKQPAAVELLFDYLLNDEKEIGHFGGLVHIYAHRALKLLASFIEGFPGSSKKSKKYGEEALEEARAWVKAKRADYQIDRDRW